MEDKVVRWTSEDLVHPSQRFGKNRREELELRLLALFEVAGVALREDPHFKGKARGIRGDAEELWIFRHDAIAVSDVLPDECRNRCSALSENNEPDSHRAPPGRWWG